MRRLFKLFFRLFLVNAILLTLMLAFNNCGQPGEIKIAQAPSTSGSSESGDNHSNDSSNDNSNDNSNVGANPSPSNPLPPPSNVTAPSFRKVEKDIILSESQNADILFVVDNSNSMFDEQSNMADRFPLFIENLKSINWKVGIITTDIDDAGLAYSDGKLVSFANGEFAIDSKLPTREAQNLFAKSIQRKESGSPNEQGIYATYRFLEREQSRKVSFMRADASVNIVFLSDADETPNGSTSLRNKPSELVDYLTKHWPLKKFQFHSIVVKEGDEKCLSLSGNESYGISYEVLSGLTKGIKGSVCASDYGKQLTFLSEKIREMVRSLTLECEPAVDPETKKPRLSVESENSGSVEVEKIEGKEVFLKGESPSGHIKLEYFCPVEMVSN